MSATADSTERDVRRLLVDHARDVALPDEHPALIVGRVMTDDGVRVADSNRFTALGRLLAAHRSLGRGRTE
ncbi:hypothetical protein ACLMNJ_28405 [Streptomyces seoulensis]